MRILNIVTQMEAGGAQGAAVRLTAELVKRGHTAETWFLYLKRPTYLESPNARVIFGRPPKSALDYLAISLRLIRDLRRFAPDAVITYTHYANILGQLGAAVTLVRSRIATQRNPANTYPTAARIADKYLGALGLYTTNIAVSKTVYESFKPGYATAYSRRMRVVYNGVRQPRIVVGRSAMRARLGLADDAPTVVTIGRLAEQKNQRVLIEALQHIPDVHLIIAGDGELRAELESLSVVCGVASRVHLLGEVNPQDVGDVLMAGDVFAFPSRYEAFGFALVEAMSLGLPVVASQIPAIGEVVTDESGESAAVLVRSDDAVEWAHSLKKVLTDLALRDKLARRAAACARQYSLDAMVDGYERCFGGNGTSEGSPAT